MRVGTENKRQVYLFGGLCVVIVAFAAWELHGTSATNSIAVNPAATHNTIATQNRTDFARSLSNAGLEPVLRINQLARNEQVAYASTGRNIFSVESAPVPIEAPIAPARPSLTTASLPPPPPEPPKPPAIDVKYLGYTESTDRTYSAILVRGDDSLSARSGEIIFHRYKVGPIHPASVQVTDLSFNNTQTISITEK
jgi:hypothetical protein